MSDHVRQTEPFRWDGIAVKPYPSCALTHAAIDAAIAANPKDSISEGSTKRSAMERMLATSVTKSKKNTFWSSPSRRTRSTQA